MEPKFKVGDKVRIINNCSFNYVDEKDGALGMVGVIYTAYSSALAYSCTYIVKSDEFTNSDKCWNFYEKDLGLVDEKVISVADLTTNKCPRCKGILIKKISEGFGEIDKCLNCGWC